MESRSINRGNFPSSFPVFVDDELKLGARAEIEWYLADQS